MSQGRRGRCPPARNRRGHPCGCPAPHQAPLRTRRVLPSSSQRRLGPRGGGGASLAGYAGCALRRYRPGWCIGSIGGVQRGEAPSGKGSGGCAPSIKNPPRAGGWAPQGRTVGIPLSGSAACYNGMRTDFYRRRKPWADKPTLTTTQTSSTRTMTPIGRAGDSTGVPMTGVMTGMTTTGMVTTRNATRVTPTHSPVGGCGPCFLLEASLQLV